MKKIFTLCAIALMAVAVQAQTLINYPSSKDGITLGGTTVEGTVKIHENTDAVNCITLKNGYLTEEKMNGNHIKLEYEGGFKAGDVVTIAGAINNSDASKRGTADLFVTADGEAATSLNVFEDFINGRLVADDIAEQTYTLEADYDALYIGRSGNTGTNLTIIKVVRGEETVEPAKDPTEPTTWNFAVLSDADAANLAADADNWEYSEDNGYWANKATLAERNVFTALKANGAELEITKGLEFARDNSTGLEAGRVRIAPNKYVAVNGSKVIIKLGDLAKDDVIKIRLKGAGDSERSLSAANAEITDGTLTTADTDVHEATLKVAADGVVSFTTGNGFQFFALTINADLPKAEDEGDPNAISTVEATASTTAVYNLTGQQVKANFRGIAIQGGKKVVLK